MFDNLMYHLYLLKEVYRMVIFSSPKEIQNLYEQAIYVI